MKQAEPCGYSYGFSGCVDVFGFGVPAPVALRAFDAVLVIQADVEPHGRIERAVLMQAEPGELAIEAFAVFGAGEVAVFDAPIGDRAGDAVDELPDAVLALGRADFAVEVFADDDVRGQLAPERRNFAVGLLEEQLAVFAFDGGGAAVPLDGVERVGDIRGAEHGVDRQGRRVRIAKAFRFEVPSFRARVFEKFISAWAINSSFCVMQMTGIHTKCCVHPYTALYQLFDAFAS